MRAGFRWLAALGLTVVAATGCQRTDSAAGSELEEQPESAQAEASLSTSLPPGATPDMAEAGRQLFLPCAVCHGLDGMGNQLGPSLRDAQWMHITGTLEEIEGVIRDGIAEPRDYPVPMAPMGGGDFDEDELRAVATYVYAISRNMAPPPQ